MFNERLCPLNQKWPQITENNEFRPILVLSPLFRFLELKYLLKRNQYLTKKIDKKQICFDKKI